jgi:hypothetical protein
MTCDDDEELGEARTLQQLLALEKIVDELIAQLDAMLGGDDMPSVLLH